jgi:hypothetical protein
MMPSEEGLAGIADAVHSEGLARSGQGIELAAGARRPDLHGHAALLAQGDASLHPAARFRHLEATIGRANALSGHQLRASRTIPGSRSEVSDGAGERMNRVLPAHAQCS